MRGLAVAAMAALALLVAGCSDDDAGDSGPLPFEPVSDLGEARILGCYTGTGSGVWADVLVLSDSPDAEIAFRGTVEFRAGKGGPVVAEGRFDTGLVPVLGTWTNDVFGADFKDYVGNVECEVTEFGSYD